MGYALLKAVHVLAVVLWVGGMAFTHFFLRPALATLEPPQRLRLMHAVLGRFFAAVLVAAALVLGSGLWMVGRVARQAVQGGGSFAWPLDWVLMTALGLLMMAIFGHIRLVLYRRFVAAVAGQDGPAGAAALAQIRRWVGVNLALGVVVIAVALLV
ncbi:MAG: CopD family protein [Rubrivivax sp.]|nr:CopD family protein [Rubrivivax sp.]